MPQLNEQFGEFNAFSGADIQAYIGHVHVASIRSITYSITREVLPLYTFGDPNFRTIVKGKRAIAGNLVFTQFDKHAILSIVKQLNLYSGNTIGSANRNVSPSIFSSPLGGPFNASGLNNQFAPNASPTAYSNNTDLNAALAEEARQTYELVAQRVLKYADQIPPLDITISFTNESGKSAYWGISGITLVNEGGGYDLDQMMSEVAFTFIARSIIPLDNLVNPGLISNTATGIATSPVAAVGRML